MKLVGVIFASGEPLGAPVFIDGEAEGDRIDFLSHNRMKLEVSELIRRLEQISLPWLSSQVRGRR